MTFGSDYRRSHAHRWQSRLRRFRVDGYGGSRAPAGMRTIPPNRVIRRLKARKPANAAQK